MQLVHHFLIESATRDRDGLALRCDDQMLTYEQLDAASSGFAVELQRSGVQRGDRVVMLLENSAELVIAIFGTLKAGAVFVVLNPTTKAKKLAYVLDDCGARVLVTQSALARTVGDVESQVRSLPTVIWTY